MWRPCLALLLAASCSALRGRGPVDSEERAKESFNCSDVYSTEGDAHSSQGPATATCKPFPGRQIVMVTVDSDFMPFFQNWLHHASPFLTSSEQVVAFAQDIAAVRMLRRFLHKGARTSFKIAVPANSNTTDWQLTLAAGESFSQDFYEILSQGVHPFGSKAYKMLVGQRPHQIAQFLEQGCSVLYADIDTAWVKSPFHEIGRAGDFDMYVTDDSTEDKGLVSDNLCSCFLYMHPTSKVKAVMSRWEYLMEGKVQRNQLRFTQAFQTIRKCFPDFAVALPRKEFPPGCDNASDPTVLHANFLKGGPAKKAFLKKHKAWSLK